MGEAVTTGAATAPTSGTLKHWAALDGLRGVAVLLVLFVHLKQAGLWMLEGGHLGVHLFFVLSGFLITVLLLKEADRRQAVSLGGFARRRALRLVPALAVFMAGLIFMSLFGNRLDPADAVTSAVYSLTFTSNWAMVPSDVPVLSWLVPSETIVRDALHTWSLAIEVHFYVLWAGVLWFAARWSWSYRRIAAVACVGILAVLVVRSIVAAGGRPFMYLYFDTWSRLDAPLVGALAGVAFAAGWAAKVPARVLAWTGGLAGLAFMATACVIDAQEDALSYGLYTLLALVAAVVILVVVNQETGLQARLLSWRPLVWVGRISYSLYLWHFTVFYMVGRRGGSWPIGVRYLVAFGLAMGLAWLSYRFVEQPFLRRKAGREEPVGAVRPVPSAEVQSAVS